MKKGNVVIYYGAGHGKTAAALGNAFHTASEEGSVIIIHFLKEKNMAEARFIERLEPEIRAFRFQKFDKLYDELTETEQEEEQISMKNGINYARKVLATGECNTLILDEVLGLIDKGILSADELISLIGRRSPETGIVLTGRVLPDKLRDIADEVTELCVRK